MTPSEQPNNNDIRQQLAELQARLARLKAKPERGMTLLVVLGLVVAVIVGAWSADQPLGVSEVRSQLYSLSEDMGAVKAQLISFEDKVDERLSAVEGKLDRLLEQREASDDPSEQPSKVSVMEILLVMLVTVTVAVAFDFTLNRLLPAQAHPIEVMDPPRSEVYAHNSQ